MDAPDEKLESPSGARIEQLQDELYSLRTMLSISLILMIVFTLCVNRYLFKQVSGARGQITLLQSKTGNFSQPWADEFWGSFMNYAKAHPDYVPVIAKFTRPEVMNNTMLSANPPAKR